MSEDAVARAVPARPGRGVMAAILASHLMWVMTNTPGSTVGPSLQLFGRASTPSLRRSSSTAASPCQGILAAARSVTNRTPGPPCGRCSRRTLLALAESHWCAGAEELRQVSPGCAAGVAVSGPVTTTTCTPNQPPHTGAEAPTNLQEAQPKGLGCCQALEVGVVEETSCLSKQ